MANQAVARVVVHPTRKGWTWTQVSRNGSAAAVAPKVYDTKANAKRAGARQVAILNGALDRLPTYAVVKGNLYVFTTNNPYAVLEVVDKDPGYV